jgi:hypothetical protein
MQKSKDTKKGPARNLFVREEGIVKTFPVNNYLKMGCNHKEIHHFRNIYSYE